MLLRTARIGQDRTDVGLGTGIERQRRYDHTRNDCK
jgi:hypothetical protein